MVKLKKLPIFVLIVVLIATLSIRVIASAGIADYFKCKSETTRKYINEGSYGYWYEYKRSVATTNNYGSSDQPYKGAHYLRARLENKGRGTAGPYQGDTGRVYRLTGFTLNSGWGEQTSLYKAAAYYGTN